MAVPDYQSLRRPLLAIASDGKEHGFSELADALAPQFKLTDADRKERRRRLGLKSGRAVRSLRNAVNTKGS